MKNNNLEIGYIYIILNKINGKFYLGSTKNLRQRKLKHFRDLKTNKHHCIHLQRSVERHGIENFECLCIETSFNHIKREQELLNILDFKDMYNVSKTASGGDMIFNHPERERLVRESTERLRKATRPKPRYKEDNSNWKGGVSKSKCIDCNIEIKGKSEYCSSCYFKQRDITGKNNPFYGKSHSEETKQKIKETRVGKFNGVQSKIVIIENIEYPSLAEASRQLGIHITTICFRINSPNKKFINYNYK